MGFFKWISNLIGDSDEKKLQKLLPIVARINSVEEQTKALSDEALRQKTEEFKKRLAGGETEDALLTEAFAVVREASARTTGLRHFDVQLLGGIILHQGKVSEMKTGEGKTLVATLAAYLNAISGKGVHVVTVNDYLAKRDSEWMGPIYQFLGLSVGVIQSHMEPAERQIAYNADITYGTNNEFGFDYLRDHMAISKEECVQRTPNFAIVDEVDSILVDEARTPLIISGMVEDSLTIYQKANSLIKRLVKGLDFTIEEKTKNVVLTEKGTNKIEKLAGIEYLYDVANMGLAHQIVQSLKAGHLFERDVNYVIKENEIIIVDEFTGRLMVGRRYSDGLHQAIEAKEGVPIKQESQTLASITFQNYFRLYKKLAGMTGTAKTEEAELWKIYGLEVVVIPPNKPLRRTNFSDVIYKTKRGKYQAAAKEIEECYKKGSPVLVGTVSIEHSELLSTLLKRKGIPHHVLNAKQHAREAEIVSQAGQRKAVTISTNMAGRGTDIVLGEGVAELGGLHVIGTERHESRRIDNQLRGRSGRQGDPGSSRFYVSLEDDLMRIFGSDRISNIMERLGIEEDMPIEHPLISRAIENAQKKVEEYHFSIRKQVLEFDNVMNKQRETIYALRTKLLKSEGLKEKAHEMIEEVTKTLIGTYLPEKGEGDPEALVTALKDIVPLNDFEQIKTLEDKKEEIKELAVKILKSAYEYKEQNLGSEALRELERVVMLRVLDAKWIEQLHTMDSLREGIGLRAYGQRDPLIEYKIEAYGLFNEMMRSARFEILNMLYKVVLLREGEAPIPKPRITHSSVGRNEPCPCGSGKKHKKCCLPKEGKT